MRTKTIILSAACGLVAAAAANADSVYSVNVVGYVNKTVPAATWAIIVNPLNNGTGNTLTNLFPNFTADDAGANVYLWNANAAAFINYYFVSTKKGWQDADSGDWVNNVTLAPGQAFWFYPIRDTTVTFVGDVPTGSASTSFVAGWNLVASSFPTSSDLVTQGLTGAVDDNIYKYNADGSWVNWYYVSTSKKKGWVNADNNNVEIPTIGVGEGFWYSATGTFTWSQTFNVSQ